MLKSGPWTANQIGELCRNNYINYYYDIITQYAASNFDRAGFYDQTPVESRINNTQNLNFIRYLQHSRGWAGSGFNKYSCEQRKPKLIEEDIAKSQSWQKYIRFCLHYTTEQTKQHLEAWVRWSAWHIIHFINSREKLHCYSNSKNMPQPDM